MQRKILIGTILAAAALTPSTADAASQRAADIRACKVERDTVGKKHFRTTYRTLSDCARERAELRSALRALQAAHAAAPAAEAPDAAAAPAVEPAAAPALPVASAVAPASSDNPGGKPAWAGGSKGPKKD